MTGEDQELPAPQSRKRPHSEVEKEDSLPVPVDSPNSQELNHHVVSSESDPNKVVSSPVAINAPEKETPQRSAKSKLLVVDTAITADGGETTTSERSLPAAATNGEKGAALANSASNGGAAFIASTGADALFSFLSSSSSFSFPKASTGGEAADGSSADSASTAVGANSNGSAGAGFGGFSAYANSNPFAVAAASAGSLGGGGFVQKSPKNPFSSVTPPPNPFMSFVDKQEEHWNLMAAKQSPPLTTSSASSVFGFGTSKSVFGAPVSTSTTTEESSDGNGQKTNADGASDSRQTSPAQSEDEANDASGGEGEEEELAFSGPVNTANGEEDETCALQVRAKLYVLGSKEVERMKPIVKETKTEDGSVESRGVKSIAAAVTEKRTEWVEMGTGPVRLLQPAAAATDSDAPPSLARIVMRRESQPGGYGTKLILNESLREHTDVSRISDKALRLTVITVGAEGKAQPVSYLFKTKLVEEADNLELTLKTLSKASSK